MPPPAASVEATVGADAPAMSLREQLMRFASFADFDARAQARRLQILVSTVVRADGGVHLQTQSYRVDDEYLYPASALKHLAAYALFAADPALPPQAQVRPDDTLLVYARPPATLAADECAQYRGGRPRRHSVRDVVRRALITSSNDAYNTLVDAVGHEQLNRWLWAKGLHSARMQHRLYAFEDPVQHRLSPRVEVDRAGTVVRVIPARHSTLEMPASAWPTMTVGARYIDEESKTQIDTPMDFAPKNAVSISDLHRSMIALMVPEATVGDARLPSLDLSDEARAFLIEVMGEFAQGRADRGFEQRVDRYKPMLPGLRRHAPNESWRYVNKAGRAYGFHLDTAWIQHVPSRREMIVTVGTYVNDNGTLNDDRYEFSRSYALFADIGAWVGAQLAK